MGLISVRETASKWGIAPRRVQILCNEGRIDGAQRVGNAWVIPDNASKPEDARRKEVEKRVSAQPAIRIERIWSMPNKNTFDVKPIHDLIVDEMTEGTWIDPFANRNKLADITNDLNPEFDTDYHLDALDFMKLFGDASVDGVLYDPPYSPRQVSECYNNVGYNVTWDTTKASFWGNHKREISRIVKVGGKVITFGWNSGGIGNKYGFEITRILIVPHGGWHNDTICTVEIKTHESTLNGSTDQPPMQPAAKTVPVIKFKTDEELVEHLKKLPTDFWDFRDDDTHEYTHGLHSYPAMMVSPISRNIIKMVKQYRPVESLFDPFAGSGTVLVEGMLSGIPCVSGNDINPLALFLTKVKTTVLSPMELQTEYSRLNDRIDALYQQYDYIIQAIDDYMVQRQGLDLAAKDGWGSSAPTYINSFYALNYVALDVPDFKNIGYWFRPRVIVELSLIKKAILETPNKDIRDFFFIAMSEIIRLVSNRRNGEFKMFRMPPEKVRAFDPDTRGDFIKTLQRNMQKMSDFAEACNGLQSMPEVSIYREDSCSLSSVPTDKYDLIITSPPYGDSRTTVAYGEYSRLSLQWINLYDLSEKDIMGVDKSLMGGRKYRNGFELTLNSPTLKKSLEIIKDADIERAGDVYSFYVDLDHSIKAIAEKTRTGGYQFWVVGNRTVKGETLQTDVIITELAQQHGLIPVYTVARNISNKVMPAQNSPTNVSGKTSATMTMEHIVILRKE